MNIAELLAELEEDQRWREQEIRFFQNRGSRIRSEEEQDLFRRAVILLLYAHFEGFCKFALTLYATTVNREKIRCGEANYAIAAASLADLFKALRDPNKKCPEFRHALPDDAALHRFGRDREFVERSDEFANRHVNIPDYVVDTESNLKPVILRKNLYRLGLFHDQFKGLDSEINKLLEYRNKIAHGESRSGIPLQTYSSLREATFRIMNEIKRGVIEALRGKHYLRNQKAELETEVSQ